MSNWSDYKHEESESRTITGKQRCVIISAEEKVSNAGNPMIVIKIRPSGCKFSIIHRFVKVGNDDESVKKFNNKLSRFFDAFPEIGDGNFDFLTWAGAEGAAMFGEDNNGYLEVKYFLTPDRVSTLPPFEGEKPERQTITTLVDEDEDDGDEMPF